MDRIKLIPKASLKFKERMQVLEQVSQSLLSGLDTVECHTKASDLRFKVASRRFTRLKNGSPSDEALSLQVSATA